MSCFGEANRTHSPFVLELSSRAPTSVLHIHEAAAHSCPCRRVCSRGHRSRGAAPGLGPRACPSSAVREAPRSRRRGRAGFRSGLSSSPVSGNGAQPRRPGPSLPTRQPRAAIGHTVSVLESGLVSSPRSHLQAEDDWPVLAQHCTPFPTAPPSAVVVAIASPRPPSGAASPAS